MSTLITDSPRAGRTRGESPRPRRKQLAPLERQRRRMFWPFAAPALIVYTVIFLVPIGYAAWTSLYRWDGMGPKRWRGWRNYQVLFDDPFFRSSLTNTPKILFIGGACAFAISFALTLVLRVSLGVPGQVLIVPMFVGPATANLVDTHCGLIIVYAGLAMSFTVYLLTGFLAGVPAALEEAAIIDRANPLRTFLQIVVPVARGGLITAFLLQFTSAWNETLFALALTHSQHKITLPAALNEFIATQQFNGLDYGTMIAGICIILAPMLALFSWLGTRIIQDMTVGIGK